MTGDIAILAAVSEAIGSMVEHKTELCRYVIPTRNRPTCTMPQDHSIHDRRHIGGSHDYTPNPPIA
jgi:hypothetical protein